MPVQTVIKVRRDTQANWGSTNPVLAAGEQGFVTDTRYYKVGNGTSAWNDLPFTNAGYADTAGTANSASSATNATNATNAINQWVVARNATGATIAKGVPVYVSGSNGTNILISKAGNTTEATSSKVLGLTYASIANNASNYVITEGLLGGLNTSSAALGDSVWLGVDGALLFGLANKPVAPAHMVSLGVVTRVNGSTGEIFVKVQNGFELEELHDVLITSEADGDALVYEGASGLWKNRSLFASPTFTGNATFEDITLADDALVKGTVTIRDDLSLTGQIVDLATVTSSLVSYTPTLFSSGNYPTGYDSAYTNGDGSVLIISMASNLLRSALLPGATMLLESTSAEIASVYPGTFPYAEITFVTPVGQMVNIMNITVDVPYTSISESTGTLGADIASAGAEYFLIQDSIFRVSECAITPGLAVVPGSYTFPVGEQISIRSSDTSKINGIRYDGQRSSISFDPISGVWSSPLFYIETYQVNGLDVQLWSKAPTESPSFSGTVDFSSATVTGLPAGETLSPFLLMGA